MSHISQVIPELLVEDIERTGDFYNRVLGLKLEILYEVDGRPQYAKLGEGNFTVFLNRQPDRGQLASGQPPAKVWFVVQGIDDLHAKLQEDGFEMEAIDETAYGTKEFLLNDPDGYRIGVVERLYQE
jgi:predicted enzyme related to lactoylglutathione lyase